jgi:hypothetical protein
MVARRKPVGPTPGGYSGPLPPDIAAGPLVELWAAPDGVRHPNHSAELSAHIRWRTAGSRWQLADEKRPRWRDHLPPEVRDAADRRYAELLVADPRMGRRGGR